jgi:hypothetical protein
MPALLIVFAVIFAMSWLGVQAIKGLWSAYFFLNALFILFVTRHDTENIKLLRSTWTGLGASTPLAWQPSPIWPVRWHLLHSPVLALWLFISWEIG